MNKLVLILSLVVLSSCSFQSTQIDIIKEMVTNKNDVSLPQKNWSYLWNNQEIDIYAVNADKLILFLDEKVQIFLKDNHIYRINGLIAKESIIEIEMENNNLKFIIDDTQLKFASCQNSYIDIDQKKNRTTHLQQCTHSKTTDTFDNLVIYDSNSEIIALKFMIHPDYLPLKLRMKESISYNEF